VAPTGNTVSELLLYCYTEQKLQGFGNGLPHKLEELNRVGIRDIWCSHESVWVKYYLVKWDSMHLYFNELGGGVQLPKHSCRYWSCTGPSKVLDSNATVETIQTVTLCSLVEVYWHFGGVYISTRLHVVTSQKTKLFRVGILHIVFTWKWTLNQFPKRWKRPKYIASSVVSQPHKTVKILCRWTIFIVLSLSKNTVLFIFQNEFRILDSVSVFRWNLLSWAQSIELVPISGHLYQHQDGVYKPSTAQTICES
jgi:hypothetical protein